MRYTINSMANSVHLDQPASEEAGSSGSTLFASLPKSKFRKKQNIF